MTNIEEIEQKRTKILNMFNQQKILMGEYQNYVESILINDELILTTEVLTLEDWLNQRK